MITSLYAAVSGMIFILLSVNVIRGRWKYRRGLGGDTDNVDLTRRIRAQGNFAEYTPIFLIMLWLVENNGMSVYYLHALGVMFLIARLSHAYSLTYAEHYEGDTLISGVQYRVRGMILTFVTLGILCATLLYQFFLFAF